MNTPDTEWEKLKKEFIEELKLGKRGHFFRENPDGSVYILAYAGEFIDKLFSSRDTYWKERVEEAVKAERERILKACDVNSFLRDEDHEDFVVYLTDIETITKATPITNEDNLK